MPQVLPQPPYPDWGYEFNTEARVSALQYGDGYKARYHDGLNILLRKTTITYSNLITYEKNILKIFLEQMAGTQSFLWQPYNDPIVGVWLAPKWVISPIAAERWKITIDLQEEPDLIAGNVPVVQLPPPPPPPPPPPAPPPPPPPAPPPPPPPAPPPPPPPPPGPPPPPPPPVPVINYTGTNPIFDNTPLGTVVATFTVTMSDMSAFVGSVSLTNDDGGRFVLTGPMAGTWSLVLNPSGPGLPLSMSIENVRILAVQP